MVSDDFRETLRIPCCARAERGKFCDEMCFGRFAFFSPLVVDWLLSAQQHTITHCAFNIMSSLLFSSSVAFSRARGGSFCKASSSSSSSSSSPSSSRTTTTTKSVRFDFRSPRRRRTTNKTNKTTTTTYATTSQNDDGNTKNNNDENLMSARELKRKLEELVRCFWVIRILSGVCFSLKESERERKKERKIENERTSMIKRCIQKHHLSDLNLRWCETNTNEWDVCSFFSFLFFSFSLSLFLSLLACG